MKSRLNGTQKSISVSENASTVTETVSTPSVAIAITPSTSPTNRTDRYSSTGEVWHTTLPSTRSASFNVFFSILIFTSMSLLKFQKQFSPTDQKTDEADYHRRNI